MIEDFKVAMVDRFRNDPSMASLRTALLGGFWEQPAPPQTPFPFATYLFVDAASSWTLGPGPVLEEFRMQFDIWTNSKSGVDASRIFKLWITAWDNVKFVVPGYNLFRFQRMRQLPTRDDQTYYCGIMSEYLVQM